MNYCEEQIEYLEWQAQLEKESQDKMKLFSEYVAADAEASEPIIKKEPPKEKPLHFKYYNIDKFLYPLLFINYYTINRKMVCNYHILDHAYL